MYQEELLNAKAQSAQRRKEKISEKIVGQLHVFLCDLCATFATFALKKLLSSFFEKITLLSSIMTKNYVTVIINTCANESLGWNDFDFLIPNPLSLQEKLFL